MSRKNEENKYVATRIKMLNNQYKSIVNKIEVNKINGRNYAGLEIAKNHLKIWLPKFNTVKTLKDFEKVNSAYNASL